MNSSELVKRKNIDKIREILSQTEKVSKSDIARKTELSFPTVTRLLQELCENKEVLELAERDSTGGRSASLYMFNADYSYYLLMIVEGNEIRWTIQNLNQEIIQQGSVNTTLKGLLPSLDILILNTEEKYKNMKCAVIGLAAMVDEGVVKEGVWDGIAGIDLPVHFQNLTKMPVIVDNDMHIVALGQWHSAVCKSSSTVCIYLGSNCWFGAGIVLNGKVWRGAHGLAGEVNLLPGLEVTLRKKSEEVNKDEIIAMACRIVQTYAALFNPEQIILYKNHILSERVEEIRKHCFKSLPQDMIPNIELSDAFDEHYANGLFHLAID